MNLFSFDQNIKPFVFISKIKIENIDQISKNPTKWFFLFLNFLAFLLEFLPPKEWFSPNQWLIGVCSSFWTQLPLLDTIEISINGSSLYFLSKNNCETGLWARSPIFMVYSKLTFKSVFPLANARVWTLKSSIFKNRSIHCPREPETKICIFLKKDSTNDI